MLLAVLGGLHAERQKTRALEQALETAQSSLEAERQRTAQVAEATQKALLTDLHDDIGASLLNLVYAAPTPEFADQLRAVLQDLRDVVTRARATPGTLEQTLAQIEAETRQRLSLAGLELEWTQDLEPNAAPVSKPLLFHLFRLFREAVSNTLKHANATRFAVRLQANQQTLRIEIRDNGEAGNAETPGQGKRNMRDRADHLQGSVTWRAATQGGTKILLALPLNAALPE
ncbi:sensor histidine kinase [Ahniella affigens]|nr:ATP-binding protein [Ahniella affigens]